MSSDSLKRKPKYKTLNDGYIIPNAFDTKKFEDSFTYLPEPDDVFICTYPKCGTTWVQCILYLMLKKGEPLMQGKNICTVIPHLEDDGKDVVLNTPNPRVIKTHLPYNLLSKNEKARYIFIARNPKDCCISYFYHTKGFGSYDYADGKLEDYFELFISGKVDYGDYFEHLLTYLPRLKDSNMLFLLYEDMKTDIRACIRKIGQFLGGSFLQSCENEDILEKIVQNCHFKTMKAAPSNWSVKQVNGSQGFIRKGEVGDWRRHLTEEQAKRMDMKFKERLSGTEAEHFWDKYDC